MYLDAPIYIWGVQCTYSVSHRERRGEGSRYHLCPKECHEILELNHLTPPHTHNRPHTCALPVRHAIHSTTPTLPVRHAMSYIQCVFLQGVYHDSIHTVYKTCILHREGGRTHLSVYHDYQCMMAVVDGIAWMDHHIHMMVHTHARSLAHLLDDIPMASMRPTYIRIAPPSL
jgi:hypothetical protein